MYSSTVNYSNISDISDWNLELVIFQIGITGITNVKTAMLAVFTLVIPAICQVSLVPNIPIVAHTYNIHNTPQGNFYI